MIEFVQTIDESIVFTNMSFVLLIGSGLHALQACADSPTSVLQGLLAFGARLTLEDVTVGVKFLSPSRRNVSLPFHVLNAPCPTKNVHDGCPGPPGFLLSAPH
jgi:hypothetical protein